MIQEQKQRDWWALPACFVWLALLSTGLFPERIFMLFREWGEVTVFRAMVNNPWFVSLSCSAFLGMFAFRRCRECDDPPEVALAKGLQVAILAAAAFLPLQLENLPMYFFVPDARHRNLLLGMSAVKLLAWAYLTILVLRYYLGAGYAVFKGMPLLFPSVRRQEKSDPPPDPPDHSST